MPQILDLGRARGLLESIGSGGKLSRSEWERQQSQNELYKLQIQRAVQSLTEESAAAKRAEEDQAFERAAQLALQQSRENQLTLQGQQIKSGELALRDQETLAGGNDPFDIALSDPHLGPMVHAQLARDQAIYGKLHAPETKKRFAAESLTNAKKAQALFQSEQLRGDIQDRIATGAYGEDGEGADKLLQLLDSGATAEEVARKDLELRASMARGADKKLAQQQALAYGESVLGAIQPGTPGAEKARRALVAAQHGLIPPEKLYTELELAQRPETQTGGPKQLSKVEIRTKAHDMAVKEAHALGVTDHTQFQQLMDKNMALLLQDQLDQSPGELDPMQPLNTGAPSTQARPAAAAPSGEPSSVRPGGASATPSKPVDQATAIRAAQEAVKHGASDDELRAILEAAGIDPDAPAATVPFTDKGASVTDQPAERPAGVPKRNAPKSEAYKKPRK